MIVRCKNRIGMNVRMIRSRFLSFLSFILEILSFDEQLRSWLEFLRLFKHLQAYFSEFKTLQQLQHLLFHHNFSYNRVFLQNRTFPRMNVSLWEMSFRDKTFRPILSNSSLFMLFEIETAAKDWFLAC